jgi:hypothetical protein
MAPIVSLLTLTSLAVLLASFEATPVSAVSIHNARTPNHNVLAKRVNNTQVKRCKSRSAPAAVAASTSVAASSAAASSAAASSAAAVVKVTSSAAATSSKAKATSSAAAKPTTAQSSAKATSTPSSAPAGDVNSLFPGKKLLGWGDSLDNLPQWSGLAQRGYNWQPTTSAQTSQFGVKWCPMLWGWDQVDQFASDVVNSDTPVDCAVGFNEPELSSQSSMDPTDGANLWVKYFIPLKNNKGTLLGTPAVTSDQTAAEAWLDTFFAACAGSTGDSRCKADFMPIHFYDTSVSGFQTFLTSMHSKYGLPIVVSEFGDHSFTGGAQPSSSDVWSFASQMKSFFDSTSWIIGYAPFGCIPSSQLPDIGSVNAIMSDSHTPTDLGNFWYGS